MEPNWSAAIEFMHHHPTKGYIFVNDGNDQSRPCPGQGIEYVVERHAEDLLCITYHNGVMITLKESAFIELEIARERHCRVVDETRALSALLERKVQEFVRAERAIEGDMKRKDVRMDTYLQAYSEWRSTHAEWYAKVMPHFLKYIVYRFHHYARYKLNHIFFLSTYNHVLHLSCVV